MAGKKIGYIRVSTFEQISERQHEGLYLKKRFIDKASGKNTARPELEAMLDYICEGDTIVVHSMNRLARNLDDLRQLVNRPTEQQIKIELVSEGLTFTGEDSPMSKLLLIRRTNTFTRHKPQMDDGTAWQYTSVAFACFS